MSNKDFSFFRAPISQRDKKGKDIFPDSSKTLEEIYLLIKGDKYKERTEEARRAKTQGEDARPTYKDIKLYRLDYAIFGGVFDYREAEGLKKPSGLMCIDLDHLSESGLNLAEVRSSLLSDRKLGLRLLFVSPGGDGLKLVCESAWMGMIPPEEEDPRLLYKSEIFSLIGYVHDTHKVPYKCIDFAPSNIVSACFLCHDGDAVLIHNYQENDYPPFNSDEYEYTEDDIKLEADRESGKVIPKEKESTPVYSWIASSDWKDFTENRLIPAMYERIDELFPEMNFTRLSRKWISPKKLDLSTPKNPQRDKTFITDGKKYLIKEQGEPAVGTIDLFMQRNSLSFTEARRVLSEICGLAEEERELRIKTAQSLNKDHIDPFTMKDKETIKMEREDEFNKVFSSLPQPGEFWDDISREPEGFKTSYVLKGADEQTNFVIPPYGTTLICGLSSHYKSTILRDIALQMCEDEEEGDILLFTLEESIRTTKLRLFTALSNTFYVKARKYSKSRNISDISINAEYQERFHSSEKLFDFYLTSGRLRIFDQPENATELVDFVEKYRERRKVKAVLIDYLQRLKIGGRNVPRLDEMRLIAEKLQTYAKEKSIPFIVTAQLNRQASSPVRMGANNVAESADLSRSAETIVCIWASHKADDVTDDKFVGSKEESRLKEMGFELGTPGAIYMRLAKGKEMESGAEAVLKIEGKSGHIFGEDPVQKEEIKKPEYNL